MAISVKPIGQRKEKRNQKDKKFRQFVFNIAAEKNNSYNEIFFHWALLCRGSVSHLVSLGKRFRCRIKLDYQQNFLLKGKVLKRDLFECVNPKAWAY